MRLSFYYIAEVTLCIFCIKTKCDFRFRLSCHSFYHWLAITVLATPYGTVQKWLSCNFLARLSFHCCENSCATKQFTAAIGPVSCQAVFQTCIVWTVLSGFPLLFRQSCSDSPIPSVVF
jgi:hypothetical protein